MNRLFHFFGCLLSLSEADGTFHSPLRIHRFRWIPLFLLLVSMVGSAELHAQEVDKNYVDGQLLFSLKPDFYQKHAASLDEVGQLLDGLGWVDDAANDLSQPFSNFAASNDYWGNFYLLAFDEIAAIEDYREELSIIEAIAEVYKVPLAHTSQLGTPNDPDFLNGQQWHLPTVQAMAAWAQVSAAPASSKVVIAVIDDAVDLNHPDLAANLWDSGDAVGGGDDDGNGFVDDTHGYDFGNNDGDPSTPSSAHATFFAHGTHVAGIANAVTNNNTGISALPYNVELMALKCAHDQSPTPGSFSILPVISGINYAAQNGADIINLSLGTPINFKILETAIDYAHAQGAMVVAAAGNAGNSIAPYPAGFANAIAVAASDNNDLKAGFSNFGAWVDVTAPGVGIYSTLPANSYGFNSGTSMACPLVASALALLKVHRPNAPNSFIIDCLLNNTDPIDALNQAFAGKLGTGRLNVFQAVQCTSGLLAAITLDDNSPCVGQTVTFTATANAGATYTWDFGDNSATQTTTTPTISYAYTSVLSPVITLTVSDGINTATDQTAISVSDCLSGTGPQCLDCGSYQNLIQNGDFETGVIAPAGTDLLTGVQCSPDYYEVVTTSMDLCSGFTPAILDRTNPDTGFFMMIDGKSGIPSTVWEQTVQVVNGQTYSLSFWVNYAAAISYPLTLNVLLDGQDLNDQQIASFPIQDGGWMEYCTTWQATISGTVSLIIQQPSGGFTGYDYGLDDVFFGHCASCDITPQFTWSLDDTNCTLSVDDQSLITNGTITGYTWKVIDLNSGQTVHTATQANSSFQIPSNTHLNYEICLEVTGNEGECTESVCEQIEVACPNCAYDDLLSDFTGQLCDNDLILDLTSWSANWGSQLTLTPAFGSPQTVGINGGQVHDLRDYFNIACSNDPCGLNTQYQLLFEADHPFCQSVQVTSGTFEVICCEPEPCEVTPDFSATFRFKNDCSVILQDQSAIQGGTITDWQWEAFDHNGDLVFSGNQPGVSFQRNFGSYVKICLKVTGNDGGCVSEICREWDNLGACSILGGPIDLSLETEGDEVIVYPNPTEGAVQIDASFDTDPTQLILRDASGRKVDVAIKALSKKRFLLDLKNQIRGIYHLTIRNGNQIEHKTLMKN
ncbi:MAG: S8 family serine peptidase [Bacteroidota bacterium]